MGRRASLMFVAAAGIAGLLYSTPLVVRGDRTLAMVGGETGVRTGSGGAGDCVYSHPRIIRSTPLPDPVVGALVSALSGGDRFAALYTSGHEHYSAHLLDLPSGKAASVPETASMFAYPRTASIGDLSIVVWGENSSASGHMPKELWYAWHDGAKGWSRSGLLVRSTTGFWWSEISGALVVHDSSAMVVTGADGHVYAIEISANTDGIDVASIAQVPSMYYAATASNDDITVAFVGVDPEAKLQSTVIAEGGAVFIAKSKRGASSWEYFVVPGSIPGQIQEPILLREAEGRLHVLWPASGGRSARDVLAHAVSNDQGETWVQLKDLDLPDGFYFTRALIDACGTLHVVFRGPMPGSRPGYTRWSNGEWSTIYYLPGNAAGGLSFLGENEGGIELIWISMLPLDTHWRDASFQRVQARIFKTGG